MNTKDDKSRLAAAWLAQAQDVDIPAEAVDAPARMAERFGKITREAAAGLRFEMEPSGFQPIFKTIADSEKNHDR
jgi:hypothetical protein